MRNLNEHISQIERDEDIDVIGCGEVGSRAWGFSNDSSDYDLRFVFSRDTKNYVFDYDVEESVTYESGEIEAVGWDITKFYEMICENNPSALEALKSPVIYRKLDGHTDLREHVSNRFNVIELWINYQTWCERMYNEYLRNGNRTTVKKNLLTVRIMLNGEYARHTHNYPPLKFEKLLNNIEGRVDEIDIDLNSVRRVADMKRSGEGSRDIGNMFGSQIEEFISEDVGTDFNPEDHIRDESNQLDKGYISDILYRSIK